MRRFSVVFLSLILCLCSLVGCAERKDKYGFYHQSTLNKNLIPDLPKIRSGGKTSLEHGRFVFSTTEEKFDEYLMSVYDYLVSCSFEYFGYPIEVLQHAFIVDTQYAFAYGSELSDFQTDIDLLEDGFYEKDITGKHFFFVWGNEGISDEIEFGGYNQIINAKFMKIGFWPLDSEGNVSAYIELKYVVFCSLFYLPAD